MLFDALRKVLSCHGSLVKVHVTKAVERANARAKRPRNNEWETLLDENLLGPPPPYSDVNYNV